LDAGRQSTRLDWARPGAEEFLDCDFLAKMHGLGGTTEHAQIAVFPQTEGGREIEHIILVIADEAKSFGRAKAGA
jgi:hypothetical protein